MYFVLFCFQQASVPSLDTSRLDSVGSDHFAWLDKQQSAVADFKVTVRKTGISLVSFFSHFY